MELEDIFEAVHSHILRSSLYVGLFLCLISTLFYSQHKIVAIILFLFTFPALFFQDKDAVRAAAFTLFGELSRFGDGPSKAPFLEQVHTNLISVLLHLNEENEVIKVCFVLIYRLSGLNGF